MTNSHTLSSFSRVIISTPSPAVPSVSISEYVANGGHLVLTMRTGVKDANNLCMTEMELPGRLGELCGIEVPEYDCLLETTGGVLYGKKEYAIEKWCDIITLNV